MSIFSYENMCTFNVYIHKHTLTQRDNILNGLEDLRGFIISGCHLNNMHYIGNTVLIEDN